MARPLLFLPLSAALFLAQGFLTARAAPEEWRLVEAEACGANPQPHCLQELRKVCHEHATFRCYYSRKARLDAVRQIDFPSDLPHHGDEY